jgi:uncharacterized surface protein with fasciclin (FAS1) repeats
MKKIYTSIAVLALVATAALGMGQDARMTAGQNPMVGGMAMYANKSIVENAVNSSDHTTLVAAVKAAGLVDALAGKGPFTVFAPVNGAFDMLPAGTVDTLLKPENKDMLVKILTYHVVAGRWTYDSLGKAIRSGNGTAELKTLSGGKLWAMWNGPRNIVIKDESGATASITTYDVMQSNGVIQVINKVLMSK